MSLLYMSIHQTIKLIMKTKKIMCSGLLIILVAGLFSACQHNQAAEVKAKNTNELPKKETAASKPDDASVGTIETENYIMKLHRAFTYSPKKSEVMANWTPKQGYRFIYLDVSLRNKSVQPLDGGFVFIALKVTDKNGTEYKKPAAALAAYTSDHPEAQNLKEYNALWEKFEPNEFHREIIYAVEVPEDINEFILSLPADKRRKEWKQLSFTL
jgi:hypothetical protein